MAAVFNGPIFSPSVENLVAQLTRLPGIGARTAQRLAFHILQKPPEEALALAAALDRGEGARPVLPRVRQPDRGGALRDLHRHAGATERSICVVEQPVDVISLERTHEFRGLYHVLGGALSPIDGVDPSDLRIDELLRRVERARRAGDRAGHQPEHDGRGDRRLRRRPATRSGSGHPTRERAAGRGRPRVRRRGHPRPGAHRAAARCNASARAAVTRLRQEPLRAVRDPVAEARQPGALRTRPR